MRAVPEDDEDDAAIHELGKRSRDPPGRPSVDAGELLVARRPTDDRKHAQEVARRRCPCRAVAAGRRPSPLPSVPSGRDGLHPERRARRLGPDLRSLPRVERQDRARARAVRHRRDERPSSRTRNRSGPSDRRNASPNVPRSATAGKPPPSRRAAQRRSPPGRGNGTRPSVELIDPLEVVDGQDRRPDPTYGSVDRLEETHRFQGRRMVVRQGGDRIVLQVGARRQADRASRLPPRAGHFARVRSPGPGEDARNLRVCLLRRAGESCPVPARQYQDGGGRRSRSVEPRLLRSRSARHRDRRTASHSAPTPGPTPWGSGGCI